MMIRARVVKLLKHMKEHGNALAQYSENCDF